MSERSQNPFRPTRYEHHKQPLIWMSPLARQLQETGSFHVAGTRGSGKTSLLKALDWRERLVNTSLKDQLIDDERNLVAVYFRIPDHISFAFHQVTWADFYPNAPDIEALSFLAFSYLIECIAANQMLEAIDGLRLQGEVKISALKCQEITLSIRERFPKINRQIGSDRGPLSELAHDFDQAQRRFNSNITKGFVREAVDAIPNYEPGEIILTLTKLIRSKIETRTNPNLSLKICIDDCEVLRQTQQRYLNSLVRKTQHSLSWVISYVGYNYEATSGVYPEHNLTDADRKVVNLDAVLEKDYLKLCEVVSSLRIFYSLTREQRRKYQSTKDSLFKLNDIFGSHSINHLVAYALKSSLSDRTDQLEADAQELGLAISQVRKRVRAPMLRKNVAEEIIPPYFEAYLLRELNKGHFDIESIREIESKKEFMRKFSYLRRKQRGALISICRRFGISKIPYAGKFVILGMSDNCIRDYLEVVAEIYERYKIKGNSLVNFFDRPNGAELSIEMQRDGIHKSSCDKFNAIIENTETHAVELSKLVECLGELLSIVQRSVSTAEKGIFSIDLSEIEGRDGLTREEVVDIIFRVVSRGESDGLLRSERATMVEGNVIDEIETVSFYLHRRFASMFGFSFRGPYEPLRLPWRAVADICLSPDAVHAGAWASSVEGALTKFDPDQEVLGI